MSTGGKDSDGQAAMTAVLLLAGYVVLVALALLVFWSVARANERRSQPPPETWVVIDLPMTPDQQRDFYEAYRRTADLQPGGVIVSRRA